MKQALVLDYTRSAVNGFLLLLLCWCLLLFSCKQAAEKSVKPDENRFAKIVLAEGLPNPLMLDIAQDNRIYFIQSQGILKLFDQTTGKMKTVGQLEVFDGNNAEFGIISMKLDQDFARNGYVYLQYFSKDSVMIAHISRFTIQNDSLDLHSEKKYLTIPYTNTCCHTGGGISQDTVGNLYVSTGDNSNAFFTTYALTDDRPGNLPNDALRSAGNTKDLRGKIIRIHPESDGSFTIPDGNLFPKDGSIGRPEIYIMGTRNPFRLDIDRETNILYWGEVGPDADKDSSRGPKGYDEFNRATHAGNFGWPLFIGNNKPYTHVYFNRADSIGEKSDFHKPVNFSANNTGIRELPEAQPALIWYPYDSSVDFPDFGTGGRTAIGGPVYHGNRQTNSEAGFPDYYEGSWFIADWMRNWIKTVHFDEKGNILSIERFMPGVSFKKPISMKFGPDGALYMIEFGSSWEGNTDTRLVKIVFNKGNRAPVAMISPDRSSGKTPFSAQLSGGASYDDDKDSLQYLWKDGQGKIIGTGRNTQVSYDQPGKYTVSLVVSDTHGASDTSTLTLLAGNAIPELSIDLGNKTFYRDTIGYTIHVSDAEDGSIGHGISDSAVHTSWEYIPADGLVKEGRVQTRGEVLLHESDCGGCHQQSVKSVGPAFEQIASRYGSQEKLISTLAKKIISGGGGSWGAASMSAHPQLTIEQTTAMVKYIYSLNHKPVPATAIPVKGTLQLPPGLTGGKYWIKTQYTDRGSKPIEPLAASAEMMLRSPTVYASDFDKIYDSKIVDSALVGLHNTHAVIEGIDLTGIRSLLMRAKGMGEIQIRLDAADGELAGKAYFHNTNEWELLKAGIPAIKGFHDVYLVIIYEKNRFNASSINWVKFDR